MSHIIENIIIILIVAGAIIYCVRRMFIKKKCLGSCPSGCSCGPDRLNGLEMDGHGDNASDDRKK